MSDVALTKWCSSCETDKPVECFYRHRARSDGRQVWCKDCTREHYQEPERKVVAADGQRRRLANPQARERHRRRVREGHFRRRYGITVATYDSMLASQDGCCAICGVAPNERLHVDHDHDTGRVRALLCRACNVTLGGIESGPGAEAFARYLLRWTQS